MAPVRVTRAFRLPIIAVITALGLSGCMHTSGPVATAQPQSDLDYMAYGQPYGAAPRCVVG
jgi:polysaccharide biosynthesis/export protein